MIFVIDRKRHGIYKENVTKYGEFVCSCHGWLPLDRQKEEAERLENVTKNRDNER